MSSLNELPNEVIGNIIINLQNKDIFNYYLTNNKSNQLCKSDEFLAFLLRKEFNIKITKDEFMHYSKKNRLCKLYSNIFHKYLHMRKILQINHKDGCYLYELLRKNNYELESDVLFLCRYSNVSIITNKKNYQNIMGDLMLTSRDNIIKSLLYNDRFDPLTENNFLMATAAKYEYQEIIKFLLMDNRIDVNVGNGKPLYRACMLQSHEMIKLLLGHPKLKITKSIMSILISCCEFGKDISAQLLLEDGRFDPSINNNKAIIEAARNGMKEVVKILLKDDRVDPSDQDNEAIVAACSDLDKNDKNYITNRNNKTEIVKLLLLDKRVDPFAKNNLSFITACRSGYYEIVSLLVEKIKSRINTIDNTLHELNLNNSVALIDVCTRPTNKYKDSHDNYKERIEIVKLFLDYEKDLIFDPSYRHNIAIIRACESGYYEIVELLLMDQRVNPSDQYNLAIIMASQNGHDNIVSLLMKDPRVNPADQNNESLIKATRNGHYNSVLLLMNDDRVNTSHKVILAIDIAMRNKDYYTSSLLSQKNKHGGFVSWIFRFFN